MTPNLLRLTRNIRVYELARRCFCRPTEFRSTLPNSTVTSPFSDPSRTTESSTVSFDVRKTRSPPAEHSAFTDPPFVKPASAVATPATSSSASNKKSDDLSKDFKVLEDSFANLDKAVGTPSGGSSGSGQAPPEDEDAAHRAEVEKRRLRIEKSTRYGGYALFAFTIAGGVGFCVYYGRAKRDEEGNVIHDQYSGSFLAPFYRIYDSIWEWRDFVVEPSREKLLPDPVPPPYIQPKYTVVIELKNILVAPEWTYKTGYRFAKRPALDYFLDVIGYPNFEVVIFTSESPMTAVPVIEAIDPKHRIQFHLYKDCTKYSHGQHIKDLSKLNRDLSKVIFIEWDPKAAQLQPENMLRVPEWKGNMDDTSLVDLAELLKTIHLSDCDDVRPTLEYYSKFDDPAQEFRRRAVYLAEQGKQNPSEAKEQSLLSRYSGRLFGFGRHSQA